MKKILVSFLISSFFLVAVPVRAEETIETSDVSQRLAGYIVLQVEKRGEAYYINDDGVRFYMKDGDTAYKMMRDMGLGISDKDLEALKNGNKELKERLKGKILLQVEQHGEAYYVNPKDGSVDYLKNGEAAYGVMRSKGLGITNKDLSSIEEQDLEEYKQWKQEKEEFKAYLKEKSLKTKSEIKKIEEKTITDTKKEESVGKVEEKTQGLSDLIIDGLVPAFDPNVFSYSITLPQDAYSVTMNATLVNPTDRLYVNSNPATSGEAKEQSTWHNVIKVTTISENWKSEKTYTIKIQRTEKPVEVTAGLKDLKIEGLTPAFDPEITHYSLVLPDDAYNVDVLATLQNTNDRLYVNNGPAISGETKSQSTWHNKIEIVTISANWKSEKKYTVDIKKTQKAEEQTGGLKSLEIPGLTPAFNPEIKEYTLSLTEKDYTVPIMAKLSNETDRLYINGNPAKDGIKEDQGTWNDYIKITTISQNWKSERDYKIKIYRTDVTNKDIKVYSDSN